MQQPKILKLIIMSITTPVLYEGYGLLARNVTYDAVSLCV